MAEGYKGYYVNKATGFLDRFPRLYSFEVTLESAEPIQYITVFSKLNIYRTQDDHGESVPNVPQNPGHKLPKKDEVFNNMLQVIRRS